jgi:hypothetical protein
VNHGYFRANRKIKNKIISVNLGKNIDKEEAKKR